MIERGAKAPAVQAESTQGPWVLSEELAGGPVILYFFPWADTGG